MEAEIPARLERNALKELFNASRTRKSCVCSSRASRCPTFSGWIPPERATYASSVRIKGRKAGTETNKQITKSRPNRNRSSKVNSNIAKEYFQNHKHRKQHIESYRRDFSTSGQYRDSTSIVASQIVGPGSDPYLPEKGDQRHLFNRLNLLQTLSDIYNLGVSSRDLRRQGFLPPMHSPVKQTKSSSGTRNKEEEVANILSISNNLQDCKITDVPTSDGSDLASTTSCENPSPFTESIPKHSTAWQMAAFHSADSRAITQQSTGKMNQAEKANVLNDYIRDLRRPSQKIIDGLHGSLKEELTFLRSGSDLNRKPYSYYSSTDRFVDQKQKQVKNEHRITVKEKSVNSIPNSRKGKTLYISILGRNPLNRESLNNT